MFLKDIKGEDYFSPYLEILDSINILIIEKNEKFLQTSQAVLIRKI